VSDAESSYDSADEQPIAAPTAADHGVHPGVCEDDTSAHVSEAEVLRRMASIVGWEVASQQRAALQQLNAMARAAPSERGAAGELHAALGAHAHGGAECARQAATQVHLHPDLAHVWTHTAQSHSPDVDTVRHVTPAGHQPDGVLVGPAGAQQEEEAAADGAQGHQSHSPRPDRFVATAERRSAVSAQLAGLKRRADLKCQMQ
jgi:hypothetical protein